MTSQWANFVRNHDELTLDKLSEDERQEVFDAFGPSRTCNSTDADCATAAVDARRRRAPNADGVLAGVLSPGTPVLFYGEEIGMAENLDIPDDSRCGHRCNGPAGDNGGFSRAPKRRLTRPLPDGLFGPDRVNAADQRHDQNRSGGSCET